MGQSRRITWEMKLCPFCGGLPILEKSSRTILHGKATRVAFVRCGDCEARTARYSVEDFGHTSYSIEAVKAAVDHWNQRR